MLTAAGYDFMEPSVAGTLRPESAEAEVMPGLRDGFNGRTITPEAWNVFLPGDLKVVGPDVDEARQQHYLQAAFARVAALGGQIVVFGSGSPGRSRTAFPRTRRGGRCWTSSDWPRRRPPRRG